MSRFFIDRPILAWVIAIIIMLLGILSLKGMPVAQYPTIAAPTVTISAVYPGASAKTAEDTVTQIIEQKMTGLDGLRYMSSNSTSDGSVSITLTFEQGIDPDIAQVQVQNKLSAAEPLLPADVQRQGVTVTKAGASFLQVLSFYSPDDSLTEYDITDYVKSNIVDQLSRVPGVGEIQTFGGSYAMRVWLDPQRLNSYSLTPADVNEAIRAQNIQVAAGQLGGAPTLNDQAINATVSAQSLLQTPEQFRQIFLKQNADGSVVRLSDVAKVEIGTDSYDFKARYNGKPAGGIAIKLATGANAIDTAEAINQKMAELRVNFPDGFKDTIAYDTVPFVKLSIESVVHTLIEAVVLVFLVMYLFLQNWRATIIPTLAIPVVVLGTFAVINLFGFSINTLTMFAMVLAIGLLVDDAIVVVENVERLMHEEGLSPVKATRKSMQQISGALMGITSVLVVVFLPLAFFGGSTGVIYRQFSVTLVTSMALSLLVAMVFTPALCATILKPLKHGDTQPKKGFFGWFNTAFERSTEKYSNNIARMMKRAATFVLVYASIVGVMAFAFMKLPTGFLPDEDQGVIFNLVQLPPNASLNRTNQTLDSMTQYYMDHEKESVESVLTVAGFSFTGIGHNSGIAFVKLKDWAERNTEETQIGSILARSNEAFSKIKDASYVLPLIPPAIPELGTATGFDLQLQDKAGLGHEKMMAARNQLLALAAQSDKVVRVRPNGQEDNAQYKIFIDQAQAGAMGVRFSEINQTLSSAWGGSYINDFIDRGRVKKVYVQSESESHMMPEDLNKWYVRNIHGEMVPFSSFATGKWVYGSPRLERFNGLSSLNVQGEPAPGVSSGEAMAEMQRLAQQLPAGVGYAWTGLSLEEQDSGSQAPVLYALSLLIVFLCLAGLYESWSVPLAVLLVVPLGVIGAVGLTMVSGLNNDIYFQVAIIAVVGLSAKNAIMIIEFAKDLQEQGYSLIESSLTAAKLRLRPIIMTSLAFGLGVVPLAIANGAGSGSQNAVGIGVLGGVISATILGLFFIPLFYVWVRSIFKYKPKLVEADDEVMLKESNS